MRPAPPRRRSRLLLVSAIAGLVLTTWSPTVATTAAPGGPGPEGPLRVRTEPATVASLTTVGAPAPASGWELTGRGQRRAVPVPTPPVEPAPRATAEPVEFPAVVAQTPKLRVPARGDQALDRVLEVPGVSFATAVEVGEVPVAGGAGVTNVRVAAVDPFGFRVLTPQVTADAVEVWQRIIEGDAAFTHDAGHRLEVPLGSQVPAAGLTSLRVGAYASNGVPPVADAVVSKETAEALQLQGEQELLVSIADGADAEAVAQGIADALGVQPEVLEDPQTRRAFLTGAATRSAFEPFTYIDNGDGMIQIDPAWVRRNIVSAKVPVFRGHVICHRLIIDQLRGALQEVVDAGLDHLIDPSQYGGCWVPRHIDFNPRKPLSMHAWGIAVDFNVSTNQLGAVPQLDRRIVAIFEKWGFVWGGHWRRPDGMHFEVGALMSSPQG